MSLFDNDGQYMVRPCGSSWEYCHGNCTTCKKSYQNAASTNRYRSSDIRYPYTYSTNTSLNNRRP